MKNADDTQILIDADVIRHFIFAGRIIDIARIFPKRIVLVDVVKNELLRSEKIRDLVFNFINLCKIEEVKLEDNFEALVEYSKLILLADEGEAACMALAKVEKKYIASSNLKDIAEYCKKNKIKVIATMDFLVEALMNQLYSEEECDEFISLVLSAGSRLPCDNIKDYIKFYKMS